MEFLQAAFRSDVPQFIVDMAFFELEKQGDVDGPPSLAKLAAQATVGRYFDHEAAVEYLQTVPIDQLKPLLSFSNYEISAFTFRNIESNVIRIQISDDHFLIGVGSSSLAIIRHDFPTTSVPVKQLKEILRISFEKTFHHMQIDISDECLQRAELKREMWRLMKKQQKRRKPFYLKMFKQSSKRGYFIVLFEKKRFS